MKQRDVNNPQIGDTVYWNDPDGGLCSREYEIAEIWREDDGDSIRIVDVNGDELDCFSWELE